MKDTFFLSKKHLIWLFAVFILSYFMYHTYHGKRGLIAQERLTLEYASLKKNYTELHQERMRLENKITSLGAGDGQIDPDLLTEHAKKLGYIFPDEIMITE
jgi:cell division protein FtsB